MLIASPLDSAVSMLNWSNILYVGGAGLTVLAAAYVLYESRVVALGIRPKRRLLSEIFVLVAAFICLIGTAGAVHFGSLVSTMKDIDLSQYRKQADLQISQAQNASAEAKQGAAISNRLASDANLHAKSAELEAELTKKENNKLKIKLSEHESLEKQAEANLAAQNRQTEQFAQAIAIQQQGLLHQVQAAPTLTDAQIENIAKALKPYAGQTIHIRTVSDIKSRRLAFQFIKAMTSAGIKIVENAQQLDGDYVGVLIMVKKQLPPYPPLAPALVSMIAASGIQPHFVYDPAVSDENTVYLCIGPD